MTIVVPAEAGTQVTYNWTPAFAGVTGPKLLLDEES